MSKTTPVRWWRSDEERYRPRPPYRAPPYEGPVWDLETIAAKLSAFGAYVDALNHEMATAFGVLPFVFEPPPSGSSYALADRAHRKSR